MALFRSRQAPTRSRTPLVSLRHGRWALSCAAALLIAGAPLQEAIAQSATSSFDIPAESLSDALLRFGQQAGVQLSVESSLVSGKQAPALQGRYTAEEGIRTLLSGSGLAARFTGPNTVVVEGVAGARVLAPVRVEGATPTILSTTGIGGAGVNGSTDITATEGSGSLASSNISIGGMRATSTKEIPQTVSVLTRKRIQDQNLNDTASVLSQINGVWVRPGVSAGGAQPSSRGFSIDRIQIDGGVSLTNGLSGAFGVDSVEDMAIYDHAEMLHGSDGLGQGYGSPGGTLNLVRKKPLDHLQITAQAQAGSYGLWRGEADVTGPLAFDGKLRGRAVVAREDHDYFYATSDFSRATYYGLLEADVTSSTLVTVGARYKDEDNTPWAYGMPTYLSGKNIPLRRSTCFCYPWEYDEYKAEEFFASVEQTLGTDWAAKLSLNRRETKNHSLQTSILGGVNDVTGQGLFLFGADQGNTDITQKAADLKITGAFELFGRQQEVSLGANYEDVSNDLAYFSTDTPFLPIDPFNFDASLPAPTETTPSYAYNGFGTPTYGANAFIKLAVADKVKLLGGVRWAKTGFRNSIVVGGTTLLSADVTGDYFAPSYFGVTYDINSDWTTAVSWADVWESNYSSFTAGGVPVDPTTGSDYEWVIKYGKPSGKFTASATVFRIEQENFPLLVEEGGPTGAYVASCCYSNNSDQKKLSQGVEIEAAGEVLTGLQVSAGYTYDQTKTEGVDAGTSRGKPFTTSAPKHLFKLWATYDLQGEFWNRLSLGLGVNAQSAGYLNGSACTAYINTGTGPVCAPGANLPFAYGQKAYTLVSARAGFRVSPQWSLALNVDNLLDEEYYARYQNSSFFNNYGAPASFRLTVSGKF